MVAVNNYLIGKQISDTINNQIPSLECSDVLQPVVVVNAATTATFNKITDGTDTLLVNTDGSLTTDGFKLTRITGTANNTTTTVGTVPASTIWRVYGYAWVWNAIGAAGSEGGSISFGGTSENIGWSVVSATQDVTATNSVDLGGNYFELTATQTITCTSSGAGANVQLTVFYKAVSA
jgi:hypothetical protein